MKEKGRYSKSDSTLKRILIGDIGSGKQGFKEKVPGFSYETVSKPKLDDKGLEIKGSGYTKTLCYSYDGALFDGIPKDADIVENIKKGTFVLYDNYAAKGMEQLFREDPKKAHILKKNTSTFENWKESLRNQRAPSEIIRNHQNSKPLISELSSQQITNNNNNIYNNKLRIQENNNIGGVDISVCVAECRPDEETHTKLIEAFFSENMNSVNSESSASDHALNSELFSTNSMNSESSASDHVLNSETCKTSHEPPASDHVLNSETCGMNSVNSEPPATEIPRGAGVGDTKSLEIISNKIKEYLNKECHGNSITKPLDTHINDFRKLYPEFSHVSRQHLGYTFSKVLKTVPPLNKSQQKEDTLPKPTAEKKGIAILSTSLIFISSQTRPLDTFI